MFKFFITGLFFALVTASSYAQQVEWIRYFGGDIQQSTTTATILLQTSDSAIVVIGNEKVGTGAGRMNVIITKMTYSGDTLWTRRLYGRYGITAAGAYEMDNGNYVIGGREREKDNTNLENDWQPMMVAIKPNGDSTWKQTYSAPQYEPGDHKNIQNRFVSLLATENGHTLMLNSILGVHYVLKVNAIGRVVSTRVIDRKSYSFGDMRRREGGGVIEIPYSRGLEAGVLWLNDSADTLETKVLIPKEGAQHNYVIDILPTDEGGYLVGAYTRWNARGTDHWSIYLAHTDSAGKMIADTLWNLNRFFDESLVLNSVNRMENGGYVMATTDTGSVWLANPALTEFIKLQTYQQWVPAIAMDDRRGAVLVTGSQVVNGVERGFIARISLPISSVRSIDYRLPDRMDLW